MFFLEVIKSELVCKEKKRSLKVVKHQHLAGVDGILYPIEFHTLSYPSYDEHVQSVHSDSRVVLVLEPVLENFKLQLSYSADHNLIILVSVYLDGTFLSQLVYALLELLSLHRVIILYVFEHLRRE